jgi:hypothetical protein
MIVVELALSAIRAVEDERREPLPVRCKRKLCLSVL